MKHHISLFALLALMMVSCSNNQKGRAENFEWMLGDWQRINEKEGRETYEFWSRVNASEYSGFGVTLQEGDTLWYEHIKLVKSDTGWNFQVSGQGEVSPTIFALTQIREGMFICENEQNEFPKKIEYSRSGEELKAMISGGDMEVAFDFVRIDSNGIP